ncbi:MAG: Smr/MutS family protein [Acidobacteria bacterium]|nr:Smr/MutS family protein [Acidobacteriota bacterium]
MNDHDPPHSVPIEAELDLHTFAPRDVRSVVEEYVRAAAEAGLREVRLVHGRGIGVQRAAVHATLDRHPLVVAFRDAPESHLGATVATLRATAAGADGAGDDGVDDDAPD